MQPVGSRITKILTDYYVQKLPGHYSRVMWTLMFYRVRMVLEALSLSVSGGKQSYPLVHHDFWQGVGCFAYKSFHVWQALGACLEVMWRFEQRTFYIGSLRVKLILAPIEYPDILTHQTPRKTLEQIGSETLRSNPGIRPTIAWCAGLHSRGTEENIRNFCIHVYSTFQTKCTRFICLYYLSVVR